MKEQKVLFESGNELAAYAAKQINYHGWVLSHHAVPQIAEALDLSKAECDPDAIQVIAAEERAQCSCWNMLRSFHRGGRGLQRYQRQRSVVCARTASCTSLEPDFPWS